MAGEVRRIAFVATTYDIDHWPAYALEAAEATAVADRSYHDWAFDNLSEAMRDAAEAYIARHADVFRPGLDSVA
jgi:hypothetical protein